MLWMRPDSLHTIVSKKVEEIREPIGTHTSVQGHLTFTPAPSGRSQLVNWRQLAPSEAYVETDPSREQQARRVWDKLAETMTASPEHSNSDVLTVAPKSIFMALATEGNRPDVMMRNSRH